MRTKLTLLAAVLFSQTVLAGGILTNTNQNIAFNRMMSREASIGIDGVYSNPAGVAFLSDGFRLSLNIQSAFQTRTIENEYALFANNINNPNTKHTFKGNATAPIIPSFQMAYNKNKWSFQLGFAITGGGGKCTFDNGLGSFEQAIAGLAYSGVFESIFGSKVRELMASGLTQEQATMALKNNPEAMAQMQQAAFTNAKYSFDAYMKGRQYYFGLQLGAAYKFSEMFAGYVGLRVNYANNNYYGYVKDVTVAGQPTGMQISLNCDQLGWGVTPIIGVDFRPNNHFNFSARYEFKTRMRLKNQSANEMPDVPAVKEALAKFDDGKKIADDIPALLTIGAGYSPIEPLRINAGFHYFFDRQATCYNEKNRLLSRGTIEWNAGVEYDINKKFTVSAGWQNTNYGMTPEYMDDKSFSVNSNSIGVGGVFHLNKTVDINLAYFTSLYGHMKTEIEGYKSDFTRTNHVIGVGVDLKF